MVADVADVEDARCTLRVLVLDLRHESGQSLALYFDGSIDTRIDAFVIGHTPLAQMLMKLVVRVFQHLPSVEQP